MLNGPVGQVASRDYNTARAVSAGPSLIGEATERVNIATQRALTAANRLREFNDGLHGAEPTKVPGTGHGAVPAVSRADNLRQNISALEFALNELDAELSKLDRI